MRLIVKQFITKKEWSTIFCVGDNACEKGGALSNTVLEKMKSHNMIHEVDGLEIIDLWHRHAALTNEVQNCRYYELKKIEAPQLDQTPVPIVQIPVPYDPNVLCDKCGHTGIPKNKFVFSDSKTRKRQIRGSTHCEKCEEEINWFKRYFKNPKDEQAEKDRLTAAGQTWTEQPALVN